MRLSHLLQNIATIPAQDDREISGLALDSRQVKPNDVFFACKGHTLDGRKFLSDAIARGATAVLLEADNKEESITWQQNVPIIPIRYLQSQLSSIAARFFDYPTKKLRMLGITGTNGKTSCSHFIAQSLQSLNMPCGIIGTLGSGFYGALHESGLTTPDAITLQTIFNEFVQQRAQAIAMEVSSHSLDQGRVNDIEFEIGVFTNLTQDHLDYHGTMENYAAVKQRFFTGTFTKNIIINADDIYGKKWLNLLGFAKPVFAYGTEKAHFPTNISLIYTDQVTLTLEGIHAYVYTPWGEGELFVPLIGQFNLSNALAVLTALCVFGISFHEVIDCLSQLQPVPGRMQTLGGNGKPLVIIDYAHTPDALEKTLQALRAHCLGQLICVFGCGGNRDSTKRPLMAKIAEHYADRVIVTNDNPRHENPEAIVADMMRGFSDYKRVFVELDRSKAIENSIQWASAKDCILIAGKGAERYQQIGDERIPFDDAKEAGQALE